MEKQKLDIVTLIDRLKPRSVHGPTTGFVTALGYDSRQVGPGSAFFALRGAAADGHDYIDAAVEKGASLIVMEETRPVAGVPTLTVADSRQALAEAAALFFGEPTAGMRVAGVTGTNGKTTITYLLESMLTAAGMAPAVIGTVNYRFAGKQLPASHTTPESFDLQQLLADFSEQGADALVMEVSSHALDQKRVDGIRYEVGIFTNLTPEHLDYHIDMENYFASKKRFFSDYIVPQSGRAVINIDDRYGRQLASEFPDALTCGRCAGAAVRAENVVLDRKGIRTDIIAPAGRFRIESELLGAFNLSNLLCAVSGAIAMDIPLQAIQAGIAAVPVVPGRIEKIANDRDALILVDYAHTGDALENVLQAVCELKANRVITVFGCGGDRDRSKRPVMGEVAARYSDLVIVTSDNPRSEDPEAIIAEILPGIEQHHARALSREEFLQADARGYCVEPERRRALEKAVAMLQPGDLLLVAGKGHEDYQIVGKQRLHFDDREEIRQALAAPGRC